jgi:hypothetical protein
MKKMTFITIFIFIFQGTAYAQDTIDKTKFSVDEYNLFDPKQNSEISDTESSGKEDNFDEIDPWDGFQGNYKGDDKLINMRLDGFSLPNAFDNNLPKVKAGVFSRRIKTLKCDLTAYISMNYPTNTGNKISDSFIKDYFKEIFDSTTKEAVELLKEKIYFEPECPDTINDTYIFQSSFTIYSPKPGIISIVILANTSFGFFHPINFTRSLNLYVDSGQELTFTDVFPAPKQSLKKLWPYLANKYCSEDYSQGQNMLPTFYGMAECPAEGFNESSHLPNNFTGETIQLTDLGNALYFTSEGLSIFLEAYSSWGYALGPTEIFIPKAEAVEMGASPTIWQ